MAKKAMHKRLVAAEQQPPTPHWVSEMHDHFRKTGVYRVQDLQRVLGDPRESVEIRVGDPVPNVGGLPFKK